MKNGILTESNFMFFKNTFENNRCNHIKATNQLHYLAYLISGSAHIISEHTEIKVQPGDFFYIPAELKYTSHWYGDDSAEFYSLGFRYFPQTKLAYGLQIIKTTDKMLEFLKELPINDFKANSNIGIINCTAIWKFYRLLDEALKNMQPMVNSKEENMIYNAIAFMEKNNCDISELAKLSLMSQSTFYTTFKRITGFTPNEMKIKIQMQKAEVLLRTTNLSIDEIASHIGYGSTNYFRRIFKKKYGCTPAEMRKGT